MNTTLLKKYRPKTLSEFIFSKSLRNKFKQQLLNHSNIIITGPVGSGKTTIINCLANDLFKNDDTKDIIRISLNNENDTIIQSIQTFCKIKHISNYPYKICIIDDIDNVNDKIQNQISLLMNDYQYNIRFFFTCQSIVNIIQQIQNKTLIIAITYIPFNYMIQYIEAICNYENISYEIEAIKKIITDSRGDIRVILNNIQLLKNNKLTNDYTHFIFGIKYDNTIKSIIDLCFQKNLKASIIKINELKTTGCSGTDILTSMFNYLKNEIQIDKSIKMELLKLISETIYATSYGFDSDIQLYNLICNIHNCIK